MTSLFRMFGARNATQPPCAVIKQPRVIDPEQSECPDAYAGSEVVALHDEPLVDDQTASDAAPQLDIEVADEDTLILTDVLQTLFSYQQAIENIHIQNCNNAEAIADRLSELSDAISTHAELELTSRESVEQIHKAESERLKEAILSPVFTDLINLHDGLLDFRVMAADSLPENISEYLRALIDDLSLMMTRYGLTPIPDPIDVIDPRVHKIVGVEKVPAPRDGEVTKKTKGGFAAFGRVVRPSSFVVKKVV